MVLQDAMQVPSTEISKTRLVKDLFVDHYLPIKAITSSWLVLYTQVWTVFQLL
jgi:hypothetical protein